MQETIDTKKHQLEEILSKQVRDWYFQTFEQCPREIVCQICNNQVIMTLENSSTPIEKLLIKNGHRDLAEKVRFHINQFTQEFFKSQFTEVLKMSVQDCLINSNLETGQTIGIIILSGNS